jgi:sugar lactone lactonase YvrE
MLRGYWPAPYYLLALWLCLFGCFSGASLAAEQAPGVQLLWPPAPLQPRIRYEGAIASPDDIERKKGFWDKFWEFVRGEEEDDQRKPMAVTADSQGRLIVADPAGKQIHVYDQQAGKYLRILDADVPLEQPMGVAVDAEDRIYVVDSALKKIFVFSREGDYQQSIGEPGQLQRPTNISVDKSRQLLYVVDTPAHDIKVFGLAAGALLRTVGERGRGQGEFNYPSYAAVDAAGRLYVNDAINGRIQMFDPDGTFVGLFGQFGDGSGDFSAPKGVAVDSEGHIYVADAGFDNIQIFDASGRLLLYFGGSGQAPGEFWMPTGLFMDQKSDRLYVADSYNKRVQIFQYLKAEVKR